MKVDGKSMRSIWLEPDGWSVGVIDQTALPHRFATARLTTLGEAAHAIRAMLIRGAPLIGATAAYGMCLALRADASEEALDRAYATLFATRPTAINLKWALDEMVAAVRNRPRAERIAAAYRRAGEICEEDVAINTAIGKNGLPLIEAIAQRKNAGERVNVLTHCNAGWLAAVDVGTATAPIYLAHDNGIAIHVFADETRPRNQGASLTAWELGQHGVPHTVIADNTGGHLMQHGAVDLVIVGTDRVTRNADVCNKIGTYLKALAARDNNVPFYVALPSPTIDFTVADGIAEIPIEQRAADEVMRRDRAYRGRPHRNRAHRAGGFAGGELRLRRDARAVGDRPDHRAGRDRGIARRPGGGFPGPRRRGRMNGSIIARSESVACVSSRVVRCRTCRCPESWP